MIAGNGHVDEVVERHQAVHEVPHRLVGRVEDVRPVLVDVDAAHLLRVASAAYMGISVDDEAALARPPSTVGEHGSV